MELRGGRGGGGTQGMLDNYADISKSLWQQGWNSKWIYEGDGETCDAGDFAASPTGYWQDKDIRWMRAEFCEAQGDTTAGTERSVVGSARLRVDERIRPRISCRY